MRSLASERTVNSLRHLFLDGHLERLVVDTVIPPVRHAGVDSLADDFSELHDHRSRKGVPVAPRAAIRLREFVAGWETGPRGPADWELDPSRTRVSIAKARVTNCRNREVEEVKARHR